MFFKQPKIRKFEFAPRFYQPEKIDEDPKRRLSFRKLRTFTRPKGRSILGMLLIVVILAWLLHYFNTYSEREKHPQPMQELDIEIIE